MLKFINLLWLRSHWHIMLVVLLTLMIVLHLALKSFAHFSLIGTPLENLPLLFAIVGGGFPFLLQILIKLSKGNFGADLLAVIAIITAVILDQYLAATLVIIMLASGQALENFALGRASSVLKALANRMPTHAYLKKDEHLQRIRLNDIKLDDVVAVFPHGICPIDGVVIEGHSQMDESYLTGEPYHIPKAPGSNVFSGSINGESLIFVKAEKRATDSRYAKIVKVMEESQQKRPTLRRLGDQLGALFTPIALAFAGLAWLITDDSMRFLSILVIATPCPLLIAIPITIISAISMSARRGIIIKDPITLEQLPTCHTAIFDKTGTLTYGKPKLTQVFTFPNFSQDQVLQFAASLEQYSKHPLAQALLSAARKTKIALKSAINVSEKPGEGLTGVIEGHTIHLTDRKHIIETTPITVDQFPPLSHGLECILVVDNQYAATFKFHDVPRREGVAFINHLSSAHNFEHIVLLSGDKESEVKHLGEILGIHEMRSSQSPEQKLEIVRQYVAKNPTLFVGDGINDAPALTLATVGIAFGKESNITAEAAGVVIMDSTLNKVDELIHISYAMRKIALQSAVGGMLLSLIGMSFAAAGFITPIVGALLQEGIDVIAILNALRLTWGSNVEYKMR